MLYEVRPNRGRTGGSAPACRVLPLARLFYR